MTAVPVSNTLIPSNISALLQSASCEDASCILPQDLRSQYIYALGTVNVRFPSLSVEKEFFQALTPVAGTQSPADLNITDDVDLLQLNLTKNLSAKIYSVLSQPANLYIAREMYWSLTNADGNEIFSIIPESIAQLNALIAAIEPGEGGAPQLYIATGSMAGDFGMPPNWNSAMPAVSLSHLSPASASGIMSDVSQLDSSVTGANLQQLVDEILSLNANDGMADHDRALNYFLYNNPVMYLRAYQHLYGTENNGPNPSGYQVIRVRTQWASNSSRKVVRIIFDFAGINTGAIQSWYGAVDVTGEFPFLLTSYSRYLQRD